PRCSARTTSTPCSCSAVRSTPVGWRTRARSSRRRGSAARCRARTRCTRCSRRAWPRWSEWRWRGRWGGLPAAGGGAPARGARPADAVDGVAPALVVEPASVEEVSGVLEVAHQARLAVLPRGAGTELGLGNPPTRADLVLSTRRLDRIVEHAAGDL